MYKYIYHNWKKFKKRRQPKNYTCFLGEFFLGFWLILAILRRFQPLCVVLGHVTFISPTITYCRERTVIYLSISLSIFIYSGSSPHRLQGEEIGHDTRGPVLGPFLTNLLEKVRNLDKNSLCFNLRLTAIISKVIHRIA